MSPSSESSGSSRSSFSSSSTSNKSSSSMSMEHTLMQTHHTHPLPPPPPPPVVTTLSLSFAGVPLTNVQPHLQNQQISANNNELLPRFDSLSSLLRRKRICENISKRMMKNRESAARSRARKQIVEMGSKQDPNEKKGKNKLRRSGSI
ncbi:protein FD isoform X2 [Arachis ipaensis]|uniref:protein FD isoform X2 n=1 Tax=Arachis ipaensis TaxID=130454 RepID=UPI000A2B20E1|nr:protein FD isoform X2 [Arachis ipaensis]